ncbi:MAG: dehydrogenase [Xanthomonadales bacterium]|jgi:D-glycero-alpha-D-manno-heptose-7-phosphate kinase|nr:dehydrogenase [Xanthomonadales bacterium]
MMIRARAPLRLGLAGGGTDVSPYCDQYGGYVLNATIDRYAYAVIKPLDDQMVRFIASDRQSTVELPLQASYPLDGDLALHRAVYNEIVANYNGGKPLAVELTTFCDSPIGSGLGSSSTLVVVMIRAFTELLNLPLDDYSIAHLAYKIERVDCGLKGGKQDQYSATFGGFNFMEFYENDRVIVNSLRIKNWVLCELEASLLLYYSGVSRESARIISDQSENVKLQDSGTIEAMHRLKQEAQSMKVALLKGNFAEMVDSMRLGWESKKSTASSVSTPIIEAIYETAINAGALAGKVSGAGGGGFMMFFVQPDRRMDVIRALGAFDGQVSNCHFTKNGTQAWRIE